MPAETASDRAPAMPAVGAEGDLVGRLSEHARLAAAYRAARRGRLQVVTIEGEPGMGGEDFAYFLERVPGCFFQVGTRNDRRGLIYGHHHPRFDIDEAALPLGVELFTRLVERYLSS